MMKKNTKEDNFLDYIPVRNPKYDWDEDAEGMVTVYVENRGFFNRAAQMLLHKPRVSQIHLEQMGSYIWSLIDGKRTVFEIGKLVGEHFGEAAEPLYPRLSEYFRMLRNCSFVELQKTLDN